MKKYTLSTIFGKTAILLGMLAFGMFFTQKTAYADAGACQLITGDHTAPCVISPGDQSPFLHDDYVYGQGLIDYGILPNYYAPQAVASGYSFIPNSQGGGIGGDGRVTVTYNSTTITFDATSASNGQVPTAIFPANTAITISNNGWVNLQGGNWNFANSNRPIFASYQQDERRLYYWVVPTGVSSATFNIWGSNTNGGDAVLTIAVNPGDIFAIFVGKKAGSSGYAQPSLVYKASPYGTWNPAWGTAPTTRTGNITLTNNYPNHSIVSIADGVYSEPLKYVSVSYVDADALAVGAYGHVGGIVQPISGQFGGKLLIGQQGSQDSITNPGQLFQDPYLTDTPIPLGGPGGCLAGYSSCSPAFMVGVRPDSIDTPGAIPYNLISYWGACTYILGQTPCVPTVFDDAHWYSTLVNIAGNAGEVTRFVLAYSGSRYITGDLKVNSSDGPVIVNSGTNPQITWNSSDATFCQVIRSDNSTKLTGLSGNQPSSPSVTRGSIFSLTCSNPWVATTTVDTVNVVLPAPATVSITANNSAFPAPVNPNSSVTVTWLSAGTTSCSVAPKGWTGKLGSQIDTVASADVTYIVTCIGNDGGKVSASVTVPVISTSSTGDITIERVGVDGTVATAPAGTQGWVDSGVGSSSLNPANFNYLTVGTHTVYASDLPGYTKTVTVCSYARGATPCSSTNVATPTCDGSQCFIYVTTAVSTVTRVTVKYSISSLGVIVTGSGSVVSLPVGINCSSSAGCNASFPQDSTVTLTASPSNGSVFSGWGGACATAGTASKCNVVIGTKNLVATAAFTSLSGGVEVSRIGAGGVQPPAGTVNIDSLVATSSNPATFLNISVGNHTAYSSVVSGYSQVASVCYFTVGTVECTPSDPADFYYTPTCDSSFCSMPVSVLSNTVAKVTFKLINTSLYHSLGIQILGQDTLGVGNVTATSTLGNYIYSGAGVSCDSNAGVCGGLFKNNSTITLTATPLSNSSFTTWGGACAGVPVTSKCTIVLSADKTVTATFQGGSQQYNHGDLTIQVVGGDGTVNSSPMQNLYFCAGVAGYNCNSVQASFSQNGYSNPAYFSNFPSAGGELYHAGIALTAAGLADPVSSGAFFGDNKQVGTCTYSIGNGNNCTPTSFAPVTQSGVYSYYPSGIMQQISGLSLTSGQVTKVVFKFTAPLTLGVNFQGAGSGKVTDSSATINCIDTAGTSSGSCSSVYGSGQQVTLTPAANASSAFSGWSGSCTGMGPCIVTMNSTNTVTASFDASGDMELKRVGSDLTTGTAPGTTLGRVDALPSSSSNPAFFTNLTIGSHTVFTTDASGYNEFVGTCTYVRNAAECSVPATSFATSTGCDGNFCSLATSTLPNLVTKVVFQYLKIASAPSTGDIRIKRVGSDDTAGTAPAGTLAKVDALTAVSTNPTTSFTGLTLGAHTAYATDVTGFTEMVGTCSYARSAAECAVPDANFATSTGCAAGYCPFVTSTVADTVTKVVYKYIPITGYILDVEVRGTGQGLVSSSPAGISDCATSCVATFSQNALITLTARPSGDSTFNAPAAWTGCDTINVLNNTCTVTLVASRTVSVTFDKKIVINPPPGTARLTVVVGSDDDNVTPGDASGAVYTAAGVNPSLRCVMNHGSEPSCYADYPVGTVVTLYADTVGYNSIFDNWQYTNTCADTPSSIPGACTVTMNQDNTVGAQFGDIPGPGSGRIDVVSYQGKVAVDQSAVSSSIPASFPNLVSDGGGTSHLVFNTEKVGYDWLKARCFQDINSVTDCSSGFTNLDFGPAVVPGDGISGCGYINGASMTDNSGTTWCRTPVTTYDSQDTKVAFQYVPTNYTIQIVPAFGSLGSGTLRSQDGSIDCHLNGGSGSGKCSAVYGKWSHVVITPVPDVNNSFGGYPAGCNFGANPSDCIIDVTADDTVYAAFSNGSSQPNSVSVEVKRIDNLGNMVGDSSTSGPLNSIQTTAQVDSVLYSSTGNPATFGPFPDRQNHTVSTTVINGYSITAAMCNFITATQPECADPVASAFTAVGITCTPSVNPTTCSLQVPTSTGFTYKVVFKYSPSNISPTTCNASVTNAGIGQTVTWAVSPNTPGSTYTWSGDTPIAGQTGPSVTIRYLSPGIKNANVAVNGATPITCVNNPVTVKKFNFSEF